MPRLFLGLLFAVVTACLPARAEHTPPNIVILFADDLGINDLGCYGRKDQRTPNLDRLAAEGVRFTQAYAAASVCSASRAALLTGQSPARLRITTFLPGRSDRASHRLLSAPVNLALPAGVPTIAEVLKTKGYATMAVGKWHVGGKGHQPTDHGFDEFVPSRPNPGAESPLGGKGELDVLVANGRRREFVLEPTALEDPTRPAGDRRRHRQRSVTCTSRRSRSARDR